jgi:hypothetical protein
VTGREPPAVADGVAGDAVAAAADRERQVVRPGVPDAAAPEIKRAFSQLDPSKRRTLEYNESRTTDRPDREKSESANVHAELVVHRRPAD